VRDDPVLRLCDVGKRRSGPGGVTFELHVPELTIVEGEVLVLRGASGCGKSTLLDILAAALRPDTAATFELMPEEGPAVDLAALWRRGDLAALTRVRGEAMGYVLQTGGLLPFLTVADNIRLPARLLGRPPDGAAEDLAGRLGIARHLRSLPGKLSVGERQRVAIARALAHRPRIVLADEPTASVDPLSADIIFGLLLEAVSGLGVTAVIASHDWDRIADKGLKVASHRIERDEAGVTRSYFWT
jgi:putative ABC transport system ATP-binding protein